MLATATGVADVDPINLTQFKMSSAELTVDVSVLGVVIASFLNMLIKAIFMLFVGGHGLGIRVLLPLSIIAGTGLAMAWLM